MEAIDLIEPWRVAQVEFKFRCLLAPRPYFLDAAVRGLANGTAVVLHRCVDVAMFRVQPEPGLLAEGLMDVCIEPAVTLAAPLPAAARPVGRNL